MAAPMASRPAGVNRLAVRSFVLGFLWIYWVGSILALVYGRRALREIAADGGRGRGLAIAGIGLGLFWTLGMFLLVVIAAVFSDWRVLDLRFGR